MLGKYRILHMLGAGGMADVYEAEDQTLGRRVALKVLPPEFGRDPQAVARFEKEVRAAASLNHAHIVTIFEVDKANDIHFCAMRLLRGGDLRSRIDKGLSENQALDIIREIAQAFVHAHAAGFVHRDVKPENILFDEQGRAILTDFGIAKAMSSQSKMTATGVSIGTPRYISPEQARGQPVDGRSDLYSLGAILYEMLTGRPPFEAEDSLAMIFKHVTEPVPRLPEPFARFQPLIDTLMSKDPAARPESAAALLALIDALPRKSTRRSGAPAAPSGESPAKLAETVPPTVVTAEREHAERLAREERRQRDAAAGRRAPPPPSPAPADSVTQVLPAAPPPAPEPPVQPPPQPPPAASAPPPAAETPRPARRSVLAAASSAIPATGNRLPLIGGAVAALLAIVLLSWWLARPSGDTGAPPPAVAAGDEAPVTQPAPDAPAQAVVADALPDSAPDEEPAAPAVEEVSAAQTDSDAQALADEQARRQAEAAEARRKAAAEKRRRQQELERQRRAEAAAAAAATPEPQLSPEQRMAQEKARCTRHVSELFPGWTFTYADMARYPGATRRADGGLLTPPLATDYGEPKRFIIDANGCIAGTD